MNPQIKTTSRFKKGDRVHVMDRHYAEHWGHYIRATITDIDEKVGYILKAFVMDVPGIWMGNIWDADLVSRTSNKRKMKL